MRSQPKNKATKVASPNFKMVDADTKHFFEIPSQECGKVHLKKGMVAVAVYIEPEYDGKDWREGSISIAVVEKNLILIADAIDDIKGEVGEKKIHIISINGDQDKLNQAKEFIKHNSSQLDKFKPYDSLLSTLNPISTVDEEETFKCRFDGKQLKIECSLSRSFENSKKFSLRKFFSFHNNINHSHGSKTSSIKKTHN